MLEQYDISNMQDDDIRQAFRKCFISREGKIVLSFLVKMTLHRYLGGDCTTDELRHLEGQRHLVGYILSMSKLK